MRRRTLPALLLMLLLLPACVPQQGNQGIHMLDNPLKGLELDLAYLDVVTSMHKVNAILLEQMPISADAEWPEELKMPIFENSDEERAYKDKLEAMLARDFTFFEYYGDFDISDLFSIKSMVERPIIEMAQAMALHLEHQRTVLCGDGSCEFFGMPLEDQILASLEDRGINAWVHEGVGAEYLRPVQAINATPYNSFKHAFDSLLPQDMMESYAEAKDEYVLLVEQKAELEAQIEELKNKLKGKQEKAQQGQQRMVALQNMQAQPQQGDPFLQGLLGFMAVAQGQQAQPRQAQRKTVTARQADELQEEVQLSREEIADIEHNQIPLLKQQVAAMEDDITQAENAYLKIMEEAMATPEITAENALLAKKMMHIVESVSTNLTKAGTASTLVLGKVGVDVYYLSQVMQQEGWMERIVVSLAVEMIRYNKTMTMKEARDRAGKRIKLVLVRSVMLIPNLFRAYAEVVSTKFMLDPQVEYLEKIVAGWEATQVGT